MEEDKHLPRRPTKNKPLLKYCSTPGPHPHPHHHHHQSSHIQPSPSPTVTRAAPVTLFTSSDVHMYKQQQQQLLHQHQHQHHQHPSSAQSPSPLVAPSTVPSSMYMASLMSPNGSSFSPFGNYLFVGGPGSPGGQGLTAGHLLASNVMSSGAAGKGTLGVNNNNISRATVVTSSNPYARPISAKDVVDPPGMLVKNTNLGLNARTSSNSSISSNGSSRYLEDKQASNGQTSGGVIQTNSFLRPQSAYKVDANGNHPASNTSKYDHKSISGRTVTKSGSDHSVIHKHMDHVRPAEKGIPKPPAGSKPGNSRPPSGRKPPLPSSHHTTHHTHQQHNGPGAGPTGSALSSTRTGTAAANHNRSINNTSSTAASVAAQVTRSTSSNNGVSSSTVRQDGGVKFVIKNEAGTAGHNKKSEFQPRNHDVQQQQFKQMKSNSTNSLGAQQASNNNNAGIVRKDSVESAADASSRSSSAGSTRVRNPNYTPNKPYSEVSNLVTNIPSNDSSPSPPMGQAPRRDRLLSGGGDVINERTVSTDSSPPSVKEILGTAGKFSPTSNSPPLAEHLRDGSVKKMPVTNTLTGTIFYRKHSKAEEPIPAR